MKITYKQTQRQKALFTKFKTTSNNLLNNAINIICIKKINIVIVYSSYLKSLTKASQNVFFFRRGLNANCTAEFERVEHYLFITV